MCVPPSWRHASAAVHASGDGAGAQTGVLLCRLPPTVPAGTSDVHEQAKPWVPLMLEDSYKPNDWLGIMCVYTGECTPVSVCTGLASCACMWLWRHPPWCSAALAPAPPPLPLTRGAAPPGVGASSVVGIDNSNHTRNADATSTNTSTSNVVNSSIVLL